MKPMMPHGGDALRIKRLLTVFGADSGVVAQELN
jgi:hypothetical protein